MMAMGPEAEATYREVKARYAAVAHELSEPQRREMRSYIARLTALTREAQLSPPPEPPLKPLREAILLAVSHARERAPKLAADVLKVR
jgi:hypothetical protein